MSVTRPQTRHFECDGPGCSEEFDTASAVAGSYCSPACRDRDTGQSLLAHIGQDHRFCASCYRPRKVVYRPDDADAPELRKKALLVRESFVGFETVTEFADRGPYGIECQCGTVDHDHSEPVVRDGEPYEWWLARAVGQLRAEGQVEYEFDVATFADAYWNGADIELAVGRALS